MHKTNCMQGTIGVSCLMNKFENAVINLFLFIFKK